MSATLRTHDAKDINEELRNRGALAFACFLDPKAKATGNAASARCHCPCGSSSQSVHVSAKDARLLAKCHACGVGSDALGFYGKVHDLTFNEACAALGSELGLGEPGFTPTPPTRAVSSAKPSLVDHSASRATFQRLLALCPLDQQPDGIAYLTSRGVLSAAVDDGWGCLPPPAQQGAIINQLRQDGHDLTKSGLFHTYRGELVFIWSEHRLLIPWRSPDGALSTLQRRTLGPAKPKQTKYVFPKDHGALWPFGAHLAPGRPVAIVEGAIDALAFGLLRPDLCVLGLPGVSSALPETIRGLVANRPAIVAVDSDAAGQAQVSRIASELLALGATSASRLNPAWDDAFSEPPAKDWGDVLLRDDRSAARAPTTPINAIASTMPKPPAALATVIPIRPANDDDWKSQLATTKQGMVLETFANLELILENDFPRLVGLDEHNGHIYYLQDTPWKHGKKGAKHIEATAAPTWFERTYGMRIRYPAGIERVLLTQARSNGFHPLHEALDAAVWDGVCRIPTMFTTYFGAKDTEYTRAVARCFTTSAIMRAYTPGCQVDAMLVLEGDQGERKSSAIRALAMQDRFFLGTPIKFGEKDAMQALQGRWLVEVPELDGKMSLREMKSFLTDRADTYRPSYGRVTVDHPRSCMLVGTTNERHYLTDTTGNRRFWPIEVTCYDGSHEALRRDAAQIWAEAKVNVANGVQCFLTKAEEALAKDVTAARETPNAWEHPVEEFLAMRPTGGLHIGEVLSAVGVEPGRTVKGSEMRIAKLLTKLGWRAIRLHNKMLWYPRDTAKPST